MKEQRALKDKDQDELVAEARAKAQGMGMLKVSTIVYGGMTAIGLATIHFGHKNTKAIFAYEILPTEWARIGAAGALAAGLLLIVSYFFEDWFESYRSLKRTMTKMLGPCSIFMALYLALISSIGEEILFRGAIQPFAGLVITSILFGFLHIGQDGKISSWSIWAMLAGLLLGILYDSTGTLWAPILCHFIVNSFSILGLRRSYQALNLPSDTTPTIINNDDTQ